MDDRDLIHDPFVRESGKEHDLIHDRLMIGHMIGNMIGMGVRAVA